MEVCYVSLHGKAEVVGATVREKAATGFSHPYKGSGRPNIAHKFLQWTMVCLASG